MQESCGRGRQSGRQSRLKCKKAVTTNSNVNARPATKADAKADVKAVMNAKVFAKIVRICCGFAMVFAGFAKGRGRGEEEVRKRTYFATNTHAVGG